MVLKPASAPVYQLLIEGKNSLKLSVNCYTGENAGEFVLNSSLNPDVYFDNKKNGIFNQLFKPQSRFFRQQQ